MCGRYALTSPPDLLAALFRLAMLPSWAPRYNIAPTQHAPVVRAGRDGARSFAELRWGLVPWWSEGIGGAAKMINARSEGVATNPAFRDAFARRRCLVPLDGFYEWKPGAGGKQPWYVTRADRAPFACAGLWESWSDDGGDVETFTILTTVPNERVAALHDRMPVMLDEHEHDTWLDTDTPVPRLLELLDPFPAEQTDLHPVSPRVNSPDNDDPSCIDPVAEERGLFD